MGKLSSEQLKKLLSCLKKDPRVIVPPMPGYDAGVHVVGDKYLAVATDPCIGVPEEWFGWLLVNYAASDVSLSGAKPEFCTINLLGPLGTTPQKFHNVMAQVCSAVDELNMAIVRGHTGTYEGLSKVIGVCTAYGTVDRQKLITPGGAKPRDSIICVKPVGLETIVNFSLTHTSLSQRLFGKKRTQRLAKLVPMQSCVKEALQLASINGVHAMHDATEGGFTAAMNEISEASNLGFKIDFEKIPALNETRALKNHFKLSDTQILSMSSTGTILVAVDRKAENTVTETLSRSNVEASIVGSFTTRKGQRILLKRGKEVVFPRRADDPYARILSGKA